MTLRQKLARLPGRRATPEEVARLRALTPELREDFVDILQDNPVVGVSFSLDEENDESGVGVELRVFTPDEILDEATNAYPGIAAFAGGFVPVGACLEGSGDPYFVHRSSGALVRIPHDAVLENDTIDTTQVEVVRRSMSSFLEAATPYPK